MRFGSVCSGIEAASVAWHPLGWTAAWLAEIEPFPSAVLAHHYPDVPNLGDMTTIATRVLTGEVEAPDVFTGGTPCQAFSVAGLRESLADDRGNLTLKFVELADAIDHVRLSRGSEPTIIVWENVPGVLSTKDNAFGCFLAGLAGEDLPLNAPGGKWSDAGCVYGPKRAVAWRVLDAQYFGLAQRRKRVWVVASAREGFDPAEVLFEWSSVRRDTAPSRETGEKIAPAVSTGAPFSRTGNERVECDAVIPSWWDGSQVANTLTKEGAGGNQRMPDKGNFGAVLQPVVSTHRMVAFGEYSDDGTASAMKARDWKDATDLIAYDNTVGTLDQECGASKLNHQSFVAGHVIPVRAYSIREDAAADTFSATPLEVANAIQAHQPSVQSHHAQTFIAQPVPYSFDSLHSNAMQSSNPLSGCRQVDLSTCLDTTTPEPSKNQGGIAIVQPIIFGGQMSVPFADVDMSATLQAKNPMAVMHPIGLDEEQNAVTDGFGTLKARTAGGGFEGSVMQTNMAVRRLTPEECEALQGFPRSYTNVPWRGKPDSPDGPRYKALGNSWATNVAAWVGQRIKDYLCKTL